MSTRPARDNSKAIAAFMARKAEIDTMLARLQGLSDKHFNASPDEINWGDVGTLAQTRILTAGAQRPGNLAMPLPKGLHGAAAKKVVTILTGRGFLEEVDADIRKGEPLWRETGDGHGTTLVVTKAGLAAVGVEPVAVKSKGRVNKERKTPKTPIAPKTQRTVTKQARLIKMLEAPDGASIAEIVAATDWQAHYADV